MSKDDLFVSADKMLAAMDFAEVTAAQEERHRKQLANLLLDFLDVMDSMQALEAHCQALDQRGHEYIPLRAVSIIVRQTSSLLSKAGVEPMDAVGGPLDLNMHEVVATRMDSSAVEDTVLEEPLRGYLWNKDLLRPAKVVISRQETRAEGDSSNLSERTEL